ncbi:hypothetical protein ACP26L_36595 (plasmid) [Paenibacillus sp. S-38]|uniref:hypothetical protein n=1 Tax=Paenibacillus sp. S-38 TaxID=3416710 RepID=UPI003CEFEC64
MKKKITITLNGLNNAAFDEHPKGKRGEVARLLRELASKIESGDEPEVLLDINGNKIGTVKYA